MINYNQYYKELLMEKFNGSCMVEIEYSRENGAWHLVREYIDMRIRNRDPSMLARVTAIDLPLKCSSKRKDTLEMKQYRKDAIPWKHFGLILEAIITLGLYPRSMQEKISDQKYYACIVVEAISPPYEHLG